MLDEHLKAVMTVIKRVCSNTLGHCKALPELLSTHKMSIGIVPAQSVLNQLNVFCGIATIPGRD